MAMNTTARAHSVETTAPISGTKRKTRSTSPTKQTRSPLQPLQLSPTSRRRSKPNQDDKVALLWYETLKVFLRDTIAAGKRLERSLRSKRVDQTVQEDAILVLGGLRLLLDVVKDDRTSKLPSCFKIILTLSQSLKSCCDSIAKSSAKEISDAELFVVQVLASSALFMHYTLQDRLSQAEDANENHVLRSLLDSLSCLCSRLVVLKALKTSCSIFAPKLGANFCSHFSSFPGSLLSMQPNEAPCTNKSCDSFSPSCLLTWIGDSQPKGEVVPSLMPYSFIRAMHVIDSLSLSSR